MYYIRENVNKFGKEKYAKFTDEYEIIIIIISLLVGVLLYMALLVFWKREDVIILWICEITAAVVLV